MLLKNGMIIPLSSQIPKIGFKCVYSGNMVIQIMTVNIMATVQDRDMVSTDNQQETTNCGSNGHVTDDIKWP